MAGITGQASAMASNFPLKALHTGWTTVISKYVYTATFSTSDHIEICRVPDGAVMVALSITNNGDAWDGKINVGTKADHDLFIASQTFQNRTVYATNGLGDILDTTDGAANKYTVIQARMSDAGSNSGSNAGTLTFLVSYDMSGGIGNAT